MRIDSKYHDDSKVVNKIRMNMCVVGKLFYVSLQPLKIAL